MRKIKMPKEYPVRDEHRLQYVEHPVQLENGKWVAVEVLKTGGYISPIQNGEINPTKRQFDLEYACQAACDIHNHWLGFNKNQANKLIGQSMRASQKANKSGF
ncbi:hypothetical protein [Spirosoma litoris]